MAVGVAKSTAESEAITRVASYMPGGGVEALLQEGPVQPFSDEDDTAPAILAVTPPTRLSPFFVCVFSFFGDFLGSSRREQGRKGPDDETACREPEEARLPAISIREGKKIK